MISHGPLLAADAFAVRGQVVIVTGGAGRIGGMIAHAFAANGGNVIASDRRAEPLEETAGRIAKQTGREIVTHVGELREPETPGALIRLAEETFGRLDTIVHCGAITHSPPLSREKEDAFDPIFQINVRPLFLFAKLGVPLLEKTQGSIISIASINGHRAVFPCPLYSATKAAVIRMTTTLAAELGEKRVRVNTISPGQITDSGVFLERMAQNLHPAPAEAFLSFARELFTQHFRNTQPWPDAGTGYDVAMACLYLASPAARFVSGADLLVDGGKVHMTDEQVRRTSEHGFWSRIREHLRGLPDEAWTTEKPEWIFK